VNAHKFHQVDVSHRIRLLGPIKKIIKDLGVPRHRDGIYVTSPNNYYTFEYKQHQIDCDRLPQILDREQKY
jgi:hypothetical protein